MAADDAQPRCAFRNMQQQRPTSFVSVTNKNIKITEISVFGTQTWHIFC